MTKHYSIAEARHNLAAIVHEAEEQTLVELTRRGEPVAILLSISTYQQLVAPKRNFWDAYVAFRESIDLEQLNIEANTFEDVRDRSPGHVVE